jgi:glutamate dehydrogenase/leucine dehydrogenase
MTRRCTTEIINFRAGGRHPSAHDVGTSPVRWPTCTTYHEQGYWCRRRHRAVEVGGSVGRVEGAARGAAFCVREALRKQDLSIEGRRVAVQGFGNVGSNLALILAGQGATIVALSDSRGGVHNADGIDVQAALAHKQDTGSLEGLAGAEAITNDELLLVDCDVLAPCALEQVITGENADQIKASIVCEGANGPVTLDADVILDDRGVLVLPDVLANAGGVVVSYFEWVQGLQEYFWKESEVNAKLNDIITRAFAETWRAHEERSLPMRHAAYALAVGRVAEATTPVASLPSDTPSRWFSPRAATSAKARDGDRRLRAEIEFELEEASTLRATLLEPRHRERLVLVDGEEAFTYWSRPTASAAASSPWRVRPRALSSLRSRLGCSYRVTSMTTAGLMTESEGRVGERLTVGVARLSQYHGCHPGQEGGSERISSPEMSESRTSMRRRSGATSPRSGSSGSGASATTSTASSRRFARSSARRASTTSRSSAPAD